MSVRINYNSIVDAIIEEIKSVKIPKQYFVHEGLAKKIMRKCSLWNVLSFRGVVDAIRSLRNNSEGDAKLDLIIGIVSKHCDISYSEAWRIVRHYKKETHDITKLVYEIDRLVKKAYSLGYKTYPSAFWLDIEDYINIKNIVGDELADKYAKGFVDAVHSVNETSAPHWCTYSTGVHYAELGDKVLEYFKKFVIKRINNLYRVNPYKLFKNIIEFINIVDESSIYNVIWEKYIWSIKEEPNVHKEVNTLINKLISVFMKNKKDDKWLRAAKLIATYKGIQLPQNKYEVTEEYLNLDFTSPLRPIPQGFFIANKWEKVFGRVPKNWEFARNFNLELLKELKKHWKSFFQLVKIYGIEEGHTLIGAANLAIITSGNINVVKKYCQTAQDVHDLGVDMYLSSNDLDKCRKFFKNVLVKVLEDENEREFLYRYIISMKGFIKDDIMTLKEAKEALTNVSYNTNFIPYKHLMTYMERKGYDVHYYEDVARVAKENKWLEHKYESVPAVEVKWGKYTMRRLSKDDPFNLLVGNVVYCCQKVGGAGESCAVHAACSPDGATYVMYKNGSPIAQSWAWRQGNILVLDNVETVNVSYQERIAAVYRLLGKALVGKLGIETIICGLRYSKLDLEKYFEIREGHGLTAPASYSDLLKKFALIAGKPIGTPVSSPAVNVDELLKEV